MLDPVAEFFGPTKVYLPVLVDLYVYIYTPTSGRLLTHAE